MGDFTIRGRKIQDESDRLVVSERKKVFQQQKYGACQRDSGANPKELPIAKAGTIWTINSVPSDYNPNCKINIRVHSDINIRLNKYIKGGEQVNRTEEFPTIYVDTPPTGGKA